MYVRNKEQFRCHVFSFIISLYIIFISFFLERLWFDMNLAKDHFIIYSISKIIVFCLSFLMCFSFHQLKKDGYLSFLAVYAGIMWVMLLLIWPGIWRWDEFWVLDGSRYFMLNSYQHWLTSLLYISSLMIFPFPTGVIIVQVLLISFCVAIIIKTVNENFLHLDNIKRWILLIPFLLFPVIDSNLYPLRCSVYAFVELAFVVFLIDEIFNHKKLADYTISFKRIALFCCLSIILAIWRSESFYYAFLAPIIFFIIEKERFNNIKFAAVAIVIGVCVLFGIKYQNKLFQESIGDQNTIIITLPFIEYVLHTEGLLAEDHLLKEINQVIDLEVLYEEGNGVIWDSSKNLIKKNYTNNEFRNYLLSYAKLIFKHPVFFLKVQMPTVLRANGIYSGVQFIESTENLYSNEGRYSMESIGEVFFKHDFTRSISPTLRKRVVTVLEALENNNFCWFLHKITYNAFVPMLGFIAVILWCLYKKFYSIFGVLCITLIKIPLLILSVPGSAFMYWYPNYLIAWTITIIFVLYQLKSMIYHRRKETLYK